MSGTSIKNNIVKSRLTAIVYSYSIRRLSINKDGLARTTEAIIGLSAEDDSVSTTNKKITRISKT